MHRARVFASDDHKERMKEEDPQREVALAESHPPYKHGSFSVISKRILDKKN
jgi:hypothetical protein